MCTGGRLIADFVAGTETRPSLPSALEPHLTVTGNGLWVVWAHKLARSAGDLFVSLTHGSAYPADATARCVFRRRHDAPDPGCTCGFHALSDQYARDQLIPYAQTRRSGHGVVALSVALSGRVLAFEWAGGGVLWRAARQTVVRIERSAPLDPASEDIETRLVAGRVSTTRRHPDDLDGRPAVVSPSAPRDSGPVRLALPASAPVLPVSDDDAGWCAVLGAFDHASRPLVVA